MCIKHVYTHDERARRTRLAFPAPMMLYKGGSRRGVALRECLDGKSALVATLAALCGKSLETRRSTMRWAPDRDRIVCRSVPRAESEQLPPHP